MVGWPFLYSHLYWHFLVYCCFFITLNAIISMIKIYRFIFLFLVFFISYAAFTPSEGSSSIPYIDKIIHFLAFLILTLFMDLSLKKPLFLNKAALIFLITYAFLIEFIQYFLVYRSAEIFDFISDLLGILVYFYFAPKINIRHLQWDTFFYFYWFFLS